MEKPKLQPASFLLVMVFVLQSAFDKLKPSLLLSFGGVG